MNRHSLYLLSVLFVGMLLLPACGGGNPPPSGGGPGGSASGTAQGGGGSSAMDGGAGANTSSNASCTGACCNQEAAPVDPVPTEEACVDAVAAYCGMHGGTAQATFDGQQAASNACAYCLATCCDGPPVESGFNDSPEQCAFLGGHDCGPSGPSKIEYNGEQIWPASGTAACPSIKSCRLTCCDGEEIETDSYDEGQCVLSKGLAEKPDGWKVCLSNGTDGFTNCSNWLPEWNDGNALTGDFNGDGKWDFARWDNNPVGWKVCLSNGTNGFINCSTWLPGVNDGNALTGDFNGDGFWDFTRWDSDPLGWFVCLSNGANAFTNCSTWLPGWNDGENAITGDFNGDGAWDWARWDNNPVGWKVCLSNGANAFTNCSTWLPGWNDGNALTGDFNGDGLWDWARWDNNPVGWDVCLSNGSNAFTNCSTWLPGWNDGNALTGDFNGDGLWDWARWDNSAPEGWKVCLSNGADGFVNCSTWLPGWSDGNAITGDFNGNGSWDFARWDDKHINFCTGHGGSELLEFGGKTSWSDNKCSAGNYNCLAYCCDNSISYSYQDSQGACTFFGAYTCQNDGGPFNVTYGGQDVFDTDVSCPTAQECKLTCCDGSSPPPSISFSSNMCAYFSVDNACNGKCDQNGKCGDKSLSFGGAPVPITSDCP